jgi:hypothetical protein
VEFSTSACPLTLYSSDNMTTSRSTTVYDSSLRTSEYPQFAPPTTPSRSPYKDAGHRRSPTKLLRPTKAVPDYDEFQALLNSDITTAAEKELASRVVRAAERLKDWCTEIEQWGWSGSFEATPRINGGLGQFDGDSEEQGFSGSLPLEQVEAYESRLDTIDDELTLLEVDELKEQILGIHVGRSRPSSSYSSQSFATNLTLYNDFQLFVTETLIHTLPHHAKLKQYLKAWSARLAVLAEIPTFLRGSYRFFTLLNGAYHPLKYPLGPSATLAALSAVEKELTKAQNELREKVGELGKQLDRMLDVLEESDDRLPDRWIDNFEAEETEYTDWSYEADKKLFQLRMLETALANNHDTSAFAPPEIPIPVKSNVPEQVLEGNTRKDHEVTKELHTMPDNSIANVAVMSASSAVLAAAVFTSKDEDAAPNSTQKSETVSDGPVVAHTNDITNGATTATTLPSSEDEDREEAPVQGSDILPDSKSGRSLLNGFMNSGSVETIILHSKDDGVNGLLGGPTIVVRQPDTSAPADADAQALESVAHDPVARMEALPAKLEPVAPLAGSEGITLESSNHPNKLSELEASPLILAEQLAVADTHERQSSENLATIQHMEPMPQSQDLEYLSGGPEDALKRLEGSGPVSTEDSAIGLMEPLIFQETSPVAATEAVGSPIASEDWLSDDDGAEDENGDEGLVAADLSFLDTDPAEATAIHHLPTSFVRRASVTSIESFSRDRVGYQKTIPFNMTNLYIQIKTVTLSRRNSANLSRRNSSSTAASTSDIPTFPVPPSSTSVDGTRAKMSFGAHTASPLRPSARASEELPRPMTPNFQAKNQSASSLLSSARSDASDERQPPEDSPLLRVRERTISHAPKPPLNWAMRKRRGVDAETSLDTSRSISSPFSDMEARSSGSPISPTKTSKSPKSPMVPFEEHLSSLLDSLPAPIRLKTSSSHNAPTITSKNRTASASQPYHPRSRAPTPALSPLPTLTLAPAEESSIRRSGVNDPEIKVYNLISGKDKPIKLFVRRVGENGERIMVRVGGGWCDLGEYLRTYAEHHGRRTASDGKIEVHSISPAEAGVILPIPTTTPTSRRASLVSSIGSSAIASTTMPGSRSVSRAGAVSPASVDTPPKINTPKIVNDEFLDTPQTAGSVTSNGSRKASGLWEEGSVGGTGLMGPAVAKKREQALSEEKARWVEGVVEQAKRTVGKNSEKSGTRRVFLKGKGPE